MRRWHLVHGCTRQLGMSFEALLCTRQFVAMPSSDSESSLTLRDPIDSWNWQQCHPQHGAALYVQALQCLGRDMARAIPKKLREAVVTPLGEDQKSDLLVGSFSAIIKERVLPLSSDGKLICSINATSCEPLYMGGCLGI